MSGMRYGRLTVVDYLKSHNGHTIWNVKCDCGVITSAHRQSLIRGAMKSCGCLKAQKARETRTTHGKSRDPIYKVWHCIKQRCENKSNKWYKSYGGRGVFLSEEWQTFDGFYETFGKYKPVGGTIDRTNNDGPYSLDNCKWVSIQDQQQNKRNTKTFVFNGERYTPKKLFRLLGIPRSSGYYMLSKGITIDELVLKFKKEELTHGKT